MKHSRLIQGNEACALGAVAAGCRFYAGYPITPSSEIAEYMARHLPEEDGVFVQMEDEISSLGAVIGASFAGARAMTATSGPGFSLMQEHIGYAVMAEAPCVIVDVMRAGPSTGRPTSPSQGDVMAARWGTHGDHPAIVLTPASVTEIFELTVRAFELAETLRMPVILLYDEVLGHTRETVELPPRVEIAGRRTPRVAPTEFRPKEAGPDGVPPLPAFGDGYRFHVTGLTHDERGFPTDEAEVAGRLIRRLHAKVEAHRDDIVEVETLMCDDADIVIFAFGIVARAAKEAVMVARAQGLRVGLLRPRTIWPFPDREVAKITAGASVVLVAEMNLGQVVREVERAVAGNARVEGLFRADGEAIDPEEILQALAPDLEGAAR